uniref:endothelin-2-like n=1 Tax=Myxine glutinosa TaxID=7769 RepID=UPI00358EE05E
MNSMDVLGLCAFLVATSAALPAQDATPGLAAPGSQMHPMGAVLRRQRRCSCISLLDKECIYFCHVGIIWVNSRGKLAPYGLGNNQRSKREASVEVSSRCVCQDSGDGTCSRFCEADSSKDYRSPAAMKRKTLAETLREMLVVSARRHRESLRVPRLPPRNHLPLG